VRLQLEDGGTGNEGRGEHVIGIAGRGGDQVEGAGFGEIQEIVCAFQAIVITDSRGS
jgi:hypothetical protein